MIKNILSAQAITGGNLFVEGIEMFGELKSHEPPTFEHEVIETSGQIGKYEYILPTLKPLTATFTINKVDKIYFGLLDTAKRHKIYVKSNLTHMDGEVGVVVTFEGNLKVLNAPKFEINTEAELSFEMSATFVKYEADKETLLLYDVINSIYEANGKDIYEPIRKNIL
ncbi:phage tail protein [Campylobacter sp. FMV-PI01]|uniref:Phage tail protein n=1 Tax=Campylobacter portucalensis TaxID=2608384 RepID=A0A6L5WH31_9BACT|nr:phage major tail tube protein [Campylobacter portucalensis]MSN96349.1 phage tail protein [Campylobacter portucalensis]